MYKLAIKESLDQKFKRGPGDKIDKKEGDKSAQIDRQDPILPQSQAVKKTGQD